MAKVATALLVMFWLLMAAVPVGAADINAITPIFIVRSREFWRQGGDPKHLEFLVKAVGDSNLPSTWLLQSDALSDIQITERLKGLPSQTEYGLFLEISQHLAEDGLVRYPWYEGQWTAANRLFTSGYSRGEREKLISVVLEKFKAKFGEYPKSIGAWHIDGWSLNLLKEKYGVTTILGLADQYSTDGYQVWGQYLNQPYYISPFDPLEPATATNNPGLLKVLWAPRKQVLAFSRETATSLYSVQVNDYFRGLKEPSVFFDGLLKELTVDIDLPLAQAVIGIEVAELEPEYWPELVRQLNVIKDAPFQALSLTEFGKLYRRTYLTESPAILYESNTESEKTWWFMNPSYRLGVRLVANQLELIDLRFFQTIPLYDNDQIWPDKNANLYRVIPALIDEVSLGTSQVLGDGPVKIVKIDDVWRLQFGDKELRLYPNKPTFVGINPHDLSALNYSLLHWNSEELNLKLPVFKRPKDRCFSDYGYYQPPFSCLKSWINSLVERLPDWRYSQVNGRIYFGIRTGAKEFLGIAFPQLQLGPMEIPFAQLEYFLSLKKALMPEFFWVGRQGLQAEYFGFSKPETKGGSYGQEEIFKRLNRDKQFENGYYFVSR